MRIQPESYEAACLDYLQVDRKGRRNATADEKPEVVMPDISFLVVNSMFGTVYGGLSMSLGSILRTLESPSHIPYDVSTELAKLPDMQAKFGKNLKPMKGTVVDGAYDVDVDIFAVESGLVTFESTLQIGRSIRGQKLFKIDDPKALAAAEKELKKRANRKKKLDEFYTPTYQYFNRADYLLGNPKFADDIFTQHPTLKVDRTKTAPKSTKERFAAYVAWKKEKDPQNPVPE